LMDNLAHVAHAEWVKSGSAYWLRRTQSEISQDEKAETALNLKCIRDKLAKDQADGKPKRWTDEEEKAKLDAVQSAYEYLKDGGHTSMEAHSKFGDVEGFALSERATNRLFAAIDAGIFAEMRPGETRIYNLHPNRYQYQLPDSATAALPDLLAEESYVDRRTSGLGRQEAQEVDRQLGRNRGPEAGPIQPPIDVMVKARMGSAGIIDCTANFYDAAGQIFEEGLKWFYSNPDLAEAKLEGVGEWGGEKISPNELLRQTTGQGAPSESSPLAHPLSHDPLGIVVDAGLTKLTERVQRNVVGALPDGCIRVLSDLAEQGTTLGTFCTQLAGQESFEEKSDVLLLAPICQAEAYKQRASRKALDDYVQLARKGMPTLDDAAKYVLEQNDGAGNSGIEDVVFHWNGCDYGDETPTTVGSDARGDRSKLKFYGLLTQAQRQRMAQNGLIYGSLTPEQKELLEHWIYSSDDLMLRFDLTPAEQESLRAEFRATGRIRVESFLEKEPTYALVNGIPDDALLRLSLAVEPSALVISLDGRRRMDDCASIGYILSQQEHGEFLEPGAGFQNIAESAMIPGWRRTFTFAFRYTPRLSETFQLSESALAGSEAIKYDQLPEQWLKPLKDTLDRYRKLDDQTRNPPPP
ncbi:MAG TPA: hypothetical protein VMI31_14365, partial [Fimbriimonadaceae bacterium]|nr:hypothetical protein [Fimbriimonadaceae bacterium]